VHWHVIPVAGETMSATFRVEALPSLEFTAFSTESQSAPSALEPGTPTSTGLSVAIAVRDVMTHQRLFLAQGAQTLGSTELDWLCNADCVMLDEHTTWPHDDPQPSWRAQRKVMLRGRWPDDVPRANPDGFEPAYDGMVIDL
jgi:pyrroloquinoline quinone biosynthesis protein B